MERVNLTHLLCEYAANPLGLDIVQPQFSWQIETTRRNFHQSAYRIRVTKQFAGPDEPAEPVWDSGRISSDESCGVPYQGPLPESRMRYRWDLTIWDSEGNGYHNEEAAFFEMGLLKPDDWMALWIGCPASWPGRVLYFRRSFSIGKPVQKARVYISGLGYYELRINGKRQGNRVLDPGMSNYSKRIYYSAYDVTHFLGKENVIGVVVAPGWYGTPKLRMQLEIEYGDGSGEVIPTNWDPGNAWLVTTGPVVSSTIFGGEHYDAREERPGWDQPGKLPEHPLRQYQWINAVVTDDPGGQMVSQLQEAIQVTDTLEPASIAEPAPGITIVDAGRNLAGWARIRTRGEKGKTITLRFAESLRPDGTVNQENLRSADACDIYVMKGGEEEVWEPSFTYHGFRYIQIEGFPGNLTSDNLEIRVVRSAVAETGYFRCSNELLNQIHHMVRNTESNNLHSIPTDCPQRDERMGWLNDMTVRIDQAIYNFDMAKFYAKFIEDIHDTQAPDGTITDTAPFRWGFRPADPVSASYLLLALRSWEFYGNNRIIQQHYSGMKAWVDYLRSRTVNGIVDYSYWGDWSPPEAFGTPGSIGSGAVSRYTPGKYISTGYLYYCCRIISRMAEILKKDEDAENYRNLATETAEAINRTFRDEKNGGYGTNNQAANAFALFLGLPGKKETPLVVQNLVNNVRQQDHHLTTGNLCTKYLLEVLSENGHHDTAYEIAIQESYPSWGFMLANGATALWERWENKTGGEMNSHNHPMMGSVGSWFYKYLAGIQPDQEKPGFSRFLVKPLIPSGLVHAEAGLLSVKGMIRSSWSKKDGYFMLNVEVPPNTTARVHVYCAGPKTVTESGDEPAKNHIRFIGMENSHAVYEAGSGNYHFRSKLP